MDLNLVGIHFQRRQARHSCSVQNQTRFQAPSGAEYAAPTGLGNWVARVATKISLLMERRTGVRKQSAEGTQEISQIRRVWLKSENDFRPERTLATGDAKCSAVLSGRDDFLDALPAAMWLANFRLSLAGRNGAPSGAA
jgi:hypothetical protein